MAFPAIIGLSACGEEDPFTASCPNGLDGQITMISGCTYIQVFGGHTFLVGNASITTNSIQPVTWPQGYTPVVGKNVKVDASLVNTLDRGCQSTWKANVHCIQNLN